MNKITFKIDIDFDLELDFILIGISSSLRDYKLCHFINKATGLNLVFGKEAHIDHNSKPKNKAIEELDYHILHERGKNKKEYKNHYQIYRYCNENFEYEFYLVNNKSLENSVLIPEAANFDYFMLIKHYIDEEDLSMLIERIRAIPEVMLVKEIDPTALKSKENLIF
ncbi:MAG TPA: IPExxxVDY family protein [Sphingobacterium sp.]|nr:IPExxxVDY family protein [Sphingobacterium sp.]